MSLEDARSQWRPLFVKENEMSVGKTSKNIYEIFIRQHTSAFILYKASEIAKVDKYPPQNCPIFAVIVGRWGYGVL